MRRSCRHHIPRRMKIPIENERKYILDVDPNIFLLYLINERNGGPYSIEQGYLNSHSRVRKTIRPGEMFEEEYLFTFKKLVKGDTVELEFPISKIDFDKLWSVKKETIRKTRVNVSAGKYLWEVDFFTDSKTKRDYLVMAEVELPEGLEGPDFLPDFIQDNLLYEVPKNDKRFMNKNLTNAEEIRMLIVQLKENQNGVKS